MANLFSLAIAYLTLSLSDRNETGIAENILNLLPRYIKLEVASILQTINENNVNMGYGKCTAMKRQLGLTYEQIKEKDKVPDLNNITIEYFNKDVHIKFNINTAAHEILRAPFYNHRQRLIIFVPGYGQDPSYDSYQVTKNNLIKIGESNVLALNCGYLIRNVYERASTYAQFIGEKLGAVLATMTTSGLDPSDIYLMGHSLGAQIVGFAGKTFTKLTGQKIGRITGLDPAGPCFLDVAPDLRLNAMDAKFVDVIHTDAGVYGLMKPLGHADFYPNGGFQQPNCYFIPCSHLRSFILYAESIVSPKAFPGVRCRDWDAFKKGQCQNVISFMGYHLEKSPRGQYFLQTRDVSPYGLGRNGLKYGQY